MNPLMDQWNSLLDEVRRVDTTAREREELQRCLREEGVALEARLHWATQQLFVTLLDHFRTRAHWLKEATGHDVALHSQAQILPTQTRLHSLGLSLKEARVELYCQRKPRSLPLLHLLQTVPSHTRCQRSPRLLSFPGASTHLAPDGQLLLVPLEPDSSGLCQPAEQLVYRAFELLIRTYSGYRLGTTEGTFQDCVPWTEACS
jgi:hypothetical protein